MKTPSYTYNAVVVSIYDGDTIRVDIDLGLGVWVKNEAIRLRGINTPELKGEEREAGLVSRDWLRDQILGEEIVLTTYKDKRGKYGRLLGELYLGQRFINGEIVTAGLAKLATY